ncbi:hypothetical protein ACFOKJ_00190 [Vogesella amnigena]|uniref:Secreted protein n=1 Tax=Vogesella amnigena TaxID=1507449 RepID=A0ABV7TQF4_9NEIS
MPLTVSSGRHLFCGMAAMMNGELKMVVVEKVAAMILVLFELVTAANYHSWQHRDCCAATRRSFSGGCEFCKTAACFVVM